MVVGAAVVVDVAGVETAGDVVVGGDVAVVDVAEVDLAAEVGTTACNASSPTVLVVAGTGIATHRATVATVTPPNARRPDAPWAQRARCRTGCSMSRYEATERAVVAASRTTVSAQPSRPTRAGVQNTNTGQCHR